MIISRYRLSVKGIVQGVGFRPFIHGLAESLFLCGWVNNTGDGVMIELEGAIEALDEFLARIRSEAPQLSYISDMEVEKLLPLGYSSFEIKPVRLEPAEIHIFLQMCRYVWIVQTSFLKKPIKDTCTRLSIVPTAGQGLQ